MIKGLPSDSQGGTVIANPYAITTEPTSEPRPGWLNSYDVQTVDSQQDFRKLRAANSAWGCGFITGAAAAVVCAVPVCALVSPVSTGIAVGFGLWGSLAGASSLIAGYIGSKLAYKKDGCCASYTVWQKDGCAEFMLGLEDLKTNFQEH